MPLFFSGHCAVGIQLNERTESVHCLWTKFDVVQKSGLPHLDGVRQCLYVVPYNALRTIV